MIATVMRKHRELVQIESLGRERPRATFECTSLRVTTSPGQFSCSLQIPWLEVLCKVWVCDEYDGGAESCLYEAFCLSCHSSSGSQTKNQQGPTLFKKHFSVKNVLFFVPRFDLQKYWVPFIFCNYGFFSSYLGAAINEELRNTNERKKRELLNGSTQHLLIKDLMIWTNFERLRRG